MRARRATVAWVPVALFALAVAARAGEGSWVDRLTPPKPGSFPPLPKVSAEYRFGWSGLAAGRLQADFAAGGGGELELTARGGTIGVVRNLWRLDVRHRSRAGSASLRPIRFDQEEAYRGKRLLTAVEFADDAACQLRWSEPYEQRPAKKRRLKLPRPFDLHATFLFLRSQPLAPGDEYRLVVFPGSSGYLATVTVVRRETVNLKMGKLPAIRCELELAKIGKAGTLEPHGKFKRATGWLSDDELRIPLRFEADVFVGSVWAELVGLRGGRLAVE